VTAYNFNIDINVIEYDPLSQINNPSFFTLKAGGAAKMADALTALQDAVEKAESAYNFVFSEWGYAPESFDDTIETCQVLAPQTDPNDNGIKLHDYDPFRPCEWGGPYDFTPEDDEEIKGFFELSVDLVGLIRLFECKDKT